MNQEEKNQNLSSSHYAEEDEISLVDLLVVLLKYRRLILGITLAAIVLAVAGYIFYPQYQYKKAQENTKVEAHIEIAAAPLLETTGVKYSLSSVFESPSLLISALKEAGYDDFGDGEDVQVDLHDDTQRSRALQIVRRRFMDTNRLYELKEKENGLEITYKIDDTEKAHLFLTALYNNGKDRLMEDITPELKVLSEIYRSVFIEEDLDIESILNIQGNLERFGAAEQLISREADLLTIEEEPYVTEPYINLESFQDSFKTKGIVLVIAALFLSIFLAFVLNAFDNVRNDEESMRKINEALHKNTNKNSNKNNKKK